MSKSCTILAHVRNSKGEIVESRLFSDLLHYTSNNRELTKEYYAVGTNEEFLSKVRDSKEFQTDENGEITFKSLRSLAKMDIETDKLVQVLNKDLGEGIYPYDEALRRVEGFNENSPFSDRMMATMVPSKSGYYISVVPQTKTVTDIEGNESTESSTIDEKKKLHDVVRNEELERRIKTLLRSHGVSVKFLEGNREGGRYSTENASKMEDGLYGLIEVVEQGHTTDVLAEEAGHFAVGALGDNPLVQRIEGILKDENTQREALGDKEFEDSNLGDHPAREVAGRLVGKALQRKLNDDAPYKVLANRIANLAKRVFYGFTGNEVRWAAAKAEQIANRIAYQFVEGNSKFSVDNAINIKEVMCSSNRTMNQKTYQKIVDELGRMCKALEAVADDNFTGKAQASFAQTIHAGTDMQNGESALQMDANQFEARANAFAFDGIVQALVQLNEYLGTGQELDALETAVNNDLDNPSKFYANMARDGRNLRQARIFLRSAQSVLSFVKEALNEKHLGGSLYANGMSLDNVQYQDIQGLWHTVNIKRMLSQWERLLGEHHNTLVGLESTYFARFCENVYGSKYITTTVGILWSDIANGTKTTEEQTISIEDAISGEGLDDIDIFHQYLGSMSNNPDIIGQIVDKLVKTANKTADDRTLKDKEKLLILEDRARKLGLNTADLVELDDNGMPTGNILMPPARPGDGEVGFVCRAYMAELNTDNPDDVPAVNYGKWERAREAEKLKLWEEFKTKNPGWEGMNSYVRGKKWDEFLRPKMKKWNKANSLKVEITDAAGEVLYVKWVPNLVYRDDAWDNLKQKVSSQKVSSQKNGDTIEKWVRDYLKIKENLDAMLPIGSTTSHRLPQFKGTFMNSVRNSIALEKGNFKMANAWRKTFGRRVILENFVETAEDEDYGSMQTMNSPDEELLGTKLNYESERAARIPVFGINKLKNMQDLSTDLIGSMLAYSSMANSYSCLDNVVDALEVGRETLYRRDFSGNESESSSKNPIGDSFRTPPSEHGLRSTGKKNRAYQRYIKFLDKQVYGITATHWSIPIWKGKRLLLSKLVQNISSLGGTMFLKGNILGGTVNTLTGFNNIFKEAVVSDHFSPKDWAFAHNYYFKHFFQMWSTDIGKLGKNNRLSLFLEQMNAQSDNRTKFRNWHTNRSRLNNFYRMSGYLPYSSGDHYMQAMSYLSVAHGTNLYNTDGSLSSNLWNAYETIENTDEFGQNPTGKTIEFKRFNPLNAVDITSSILSSKGVYLKEVEKTTANFNEWLLFQDKNFADPVYRSNHSADIADYRRQFDESSAEELAQYAAEKYAVMASILNKIETYLKAPSSPLVPVAAPTFTNEEQDYLTAKGIGAGNYQNILASVREDIYNMIWTKADESAYMDKCREVNNRLHGIYNEQDKTTWHQAWYTNAFLAMKGWALGYLEYMYSNNHYSIALDRNVEGFVNTAAKIPISVLLGTVRGKEHMGYLDMLITMINPWSKRSKKAMLEAGFSEEQNFNARRMVSSIALMLFLWALKLSVAPPDKDERGEDEELSPTLGLVYYFATRTLLEQEALLEAEEAYIQSGQLMDFMPVGGAALMDLYKFAKEGAGLIYADESDSNYYYQKDDPNGRYEAGDSKFKKHFERLVPYYKSWWGLFNGYEATENYMFGRKLRTR